MTPDDPPSTGEGASGSGATAPETLKLRRQFLYVADGRRAHSVALVLQARARAPLPSGTPDMGPARVGYTTTKKVGIAVIRNRARRRLREAARHHAGLFQPGCDYVLVARTEAASLPWLALLDDLQTALLSVARKLASGEARPPRERPSRANRPVTPDPSSQD